MKKQWISVKCGLSRDPKHRRQMGKSVWTFLHMLDLADWDTGIVYDWKDENAAEDMGIDIRVLREDRRKLDDEGYITCQQKQYSQDIYIHNWTNPREYSGEVRNVKEQGGKKSPPSDFQGDGQGYAQGSVKDVTPTSYSKNKEQSAANAAYLSATEREEADKKFLAILEFERLAREKLNSGVWRGRELIPPHLLTYADWWHSITNLDIKTKKPDGEWLKAFSKWYENQVTLSTLDEAYKVEVEWKKIIAKPSELTAKAIAIQALPKPFTEPTRPEHKPYTPEDDSQFVPRPT